MALSADGNLLGFAISGTEGRGKLFLYELHVAEAQRNHGIASSLLELVTQTRSRSPADVTVMVRIHTSLAEP